LDRNKRKVIFQEPNKYYRSKTLYFHHFLLERFLVTPTNLIYLNDLLLFNFKQKKPTNTILYFSRNSKKKNFILNEKFLIQKISQVFQNYRVVTVGENEKIFDIGKKVYNSKLIISSRDGSLSYLIFARQCTSVMQISSLDTSPRNFCIARNFNMNFGIFVTYDLENDYYSLDISKTISRISSFLKRSTCH
jgi:hypothetical protein